MLECKICGSKLKVITGSHLRKHGLTTVDYKQRYGSPLVSPEIALKLSRYKGDWSTLGLGQKPDSLIARETGLTTRFIAGLRSKHGIPAFVGMVLTQEGYTCRSVYEAMYDAWLHWHEYPHEHEVPVAGLPYKSDFRVNGQYIEIAGMLHFAKYAQKHAKKRAAYESLGIQVVWLTIEEVANLYSNCPVPLNLRPERMCADCGKRTYDLVKKVCRHCYMKNWHKSGKAILVCLQCGKTFARNSKTQQRFCSHECYAKSIELDWPSWEWLDEQIKLKSIRKIAIELDINPSSLYMRLRRRKLRR